MLGRNSRGPLLPCALALELQSTRHLLGMHGQMVRSNGSTVRLKPLSANTWACTQVVCGGTGCQRLLLVCTCVSAIFMAIYLSSYFISMTQMCPLCRLNRLNGSQSPGMLVPTLKESWPSSCVVLSRLSNWIVLQI